MKDDLGIRSRLADRALRNELAPKRQAIGEVSIVGDREPAHRQLGEQRLDIAQDRLAGGGVADVAECIAAFEALDRCFV